MNKNELLEANKKINAIEDLLNQAYSLYDELPGEVKDAILKFHNENATLPYCLRWGTTAAEEIRDDWHVVVSEIKIR